MMTTDGSSKFSARSFTGVMARNALVVLALIMALVLLLWLNKEHHNVAKCREYGSQQIATTVPEPPQVHVYLEKEALNVSQHDATHAPENQKWNYNWDHKAWPNPGDAVGVPIRTMLLIRHGQYDFGSGLLNDRGRQQANLTGARLKELAMKYSRIVHSDQARAKETAAIIHKHLPHLSMEEDPLLAEGGPIPPEPTVSYWSLPERSYFVDGPRLEAAFRKYFYRADKTQTDTSIDLLVGHANIFRFFVLRALQLPKDAWMRVFISHASISLLHINPDGSVTMTKFGDSGHMPPDMITF